MPHRARLNGVSEQPNDDYDYQDKCPCPKIDHTEYVYNIVDNRRQATKACVATIAAITPVLCSKLKYSSQQALTEAMEADSFLTLWKMKRSVKELMGKNITIRCIINTYLRSYNEPVVRYIRHLIMKTDQFPILKFILEIDEN
jgi:hypothetical protein